VKPVNHDQEIIDVYTGIYYDRYSFHPAEMENTEEYIKKNLQEMGISLEGLREKSVMNSGTGIHPFVSKTWGRRRLAISIFRLRQPDLDTGRPVYGPD